MHLGFERVVVSDGESGQVAKVGKVVGSWKLGNGDILFEMRVNKKEMFDGCLSYF